VSAAHALPAGFEDLEPFAAQWAIRSDDARARARYGRPAAELAPFYDAIMPRMQQIIEYLNGKDLRALDTPHLRLLYLAMAFMEVAMPIERLARPNPQSFDIGRVAVLAAHPRRITQLTDQLFLDA
jgi:hypothetical protein